MDTAPITEITEPIGPKSNINTNTVFVIGRAFLTIAVPVLLTLLMVRLIMMPWFLEFEYNRPGFPDDIYGFTTEERLEYAPYALNYLTNDADISYLGDLLFTNGVPQYNSRELRHMEDVKVVTRYAFALLTFGGIFTLILIGVMFRSMAGRRELRLGLMQGSVLTLGIIGAIVVLAVAMWDTFFTLFHEIFFESGTWQFAFSDTLIRLFPQQFWFDAALTIGGMTTLSAVIILGVTWRWGQRALR